MSDERTRTTTGDSHRVTLDALPVAAVLVARDGRVLAANDRAADLTASADADLAGADVAALFDGVDAAALRAAATAGDDRVLDAVLETDAGDRVPVDVRASTGADADRLVVTATERDANPRPAGDDAAALSRMTDAFFAVDAEWRITYANERGDALIAAAMQDPPDGSVEGLHLWDAVPDAVDTEFYHRYREAMATQEPVTFEAYYEPLSAWLSVRAYPSESGLSVYFRDVTDRREQEDRLSERERVLREVQDITADPDRSFTEQVNAVLDVGADVLDADAGALSRIRGDVYEFEAVRGDADNEPGDTVALSATSCERTAATEQTLVASDIPADAPELTEKAGYGDWGVSCYLGAPVFVDDDVYGTLCFYGTEPRSEQFTEWEVTLVDLLSQWAGYELTRQRARDRLEAQNERLDRFASIVSHDLKNPLNVLEGRLQLAAETGDPEHVETCRSTVDRMTALVDDLLALARAGEGADDLAPHDVADLAASAWESVDADDATLTVAGDASVLADGTRATQLFANLFQNAVEHGAASPRSHAHEDAVERGSTGGVSRAQRDAGEPAGGDVAIEVGVLDREDGFYVEDDGPGIPEDDRENVFDAGFSTDADGTGFGLHIVAEVAAAHGWSVRVADADGGGARFEVTGVEYA